MLLQLKFLDSKVSWVFFEDLSFVDFDHFFWNDFIFWILKNINISVRAAWRIKRRMSWLLAHSYRLIFCWEFVRWDFISSSKWDDWVRSHWFRVKILCWQMTNLNWLLCCQFSLLSSENDFLSLWMIVWYWTWLLSL